MRQEKTGEVRPTRETVKAIGETGQSDLPRAGGSLNSADCVPDLSRMQH